MLTLHNPAQTRRDTKEQEIYDFALDRLREMRDHNRDLFTKDSSELHHQIFNTDYYIAGRYQARQWLGDETFDCIGTIKEYEENNFGEVNTDLSEPEHVVNMYVYILGEEVMADAIEQLETERDEVLENAFDELLEEYCDSDDELDEAIETLKEKFNLSDVEATTLTEMFWNKDSCVYSC